MIFCWGASLIQNSLMFDYTHAYLVGALLPAPLWLALFYFRKDLRKEILIMSLLGGGLAVLFAPAILGDYWHPNYTFGGLSLHWRFGGLEDFIYSFFIIGIGAVIYEEIFGKHFTKRRSRETSFHHFVIPALLLYVLSFYIPLWLGLSSLGAALISFALLVGVIVIIRHDLLNDALISGLILGLLVAAGYVLFLKLYPGVFQRYWNINSFSGVKILGIPIEELLWAFGQGAGAGPVYEFFAGRKFQTKRLS